MQPLSHSDAYQVLWLQLVDEGRGEALCGPHAANARMAVLPFLVGEKFPSIYFELPLKGEPFLDVTILYDQLAPGTRIDSEAAEGTDAMLDFFAEASAQYDNISCGFELDTSKPQLPAAAVHFQPRERIEPVEPFCQAVGEPERAALYLDFAERMPAGWKPSFFGMFRGRPGSPLRVCGYLDEPELAACAVDPARLQTVFDQAGFGAYDDAMLAQVSALMAVAGSCDYQFDVYPDGSLGDTFAIDMQFLIQQPEAVRASFEEGTAAKVFGLLEEWRAADKRWRTTADAAFARALPVEVGEGELGRFSLTLLPQWAKARWRNTVLQPSKLYYLGSAGILETEGE